MALLISTIVTTAVITLFSNSLTTSQQMIGTAKLDQTLNSAMESITQDIQRAGYTTLTTTATNVFSTGTDTLQVTGGNCITFAYQADASTSPGNTNRFGYQLSGGAIQYRTLSSSCGSGTWVNLTDPKIITISAFTLTLNTTKINPSTGATTATNPYTTYNSVTVSITGSLVSAPTVSRTITRTIKVFNNVYAP